MTKDQLLKLPLWQYTGEQFLELLDSHFVKTTTATEKVTSDENVATTAKRWLVYGINGLCELLQCSKATAPHWGYVFFVTLLLAAGGFDYGFFYQLNENSTLKNVEWLYRNERLLWEDKQQENLLRREKIFAAGTQQEQGFYNLFLYFIVANTTEITVCTLTPSNLLAETECIACDVLEKRLTNRIIHCAKLVKIFTYFLERGLMEYR
ncbi:DUF3853 family protein [Bacteroides acidifaciens]|uniref:DUF3853 family protein n=1 Tax=Bacteroides acidifaciens TaxID=85831 RepID=UPI0025953B59|nr:DUF3853 family protein [Bacteroides acidifaciens]